MAYNPAPVLAGASSPIRRLNEVCRKHVVGDSYAGKSKSVIARLPDALLVNDPTRVTAIDVPMSITDTAGSTGTRLGQQPYSSTRILGSTQDRGSETANWSYVEPGINSTIFSTPFTMSNTANLTQTSPNVFPQDGVLEPLNRFQPISIIGDFTGVAPSVAASDGVTYYDMIRQVFDTYDSTSGILRYLKTPSFRSSTNKAVRPYVFHPRSTKYNAQPAFVIFSDLGFLHENYGAGSGWVIGTNPMVGDPTLYNTQGSNSVQALNQGSQSQTRSHATLGSVVTAGSQEAEFSSMVLGEGFGEEWVTSTNDLILKNPNTSNQFGLSIRLRLPTGNSLDSDLEWGYAGCGYWDLDGSNEWIPGSYHSCFSTTSANWGDPGGTEATSSKAYSSDSIQNYLASSTIDASQLILFIYHFDATTGSQQTNMERMVQAHQDACDNLGLTCEHLLVLEPWHVSGGAAITQANMESLRDDMDACIATKSSLTIQRVSLYDLYEGTNMDDDTLAQAFLDGLGYTSGSSVTWGNEQTTALAASDKFYDGGGIHFTQFSAQLVALDLYALATQVINGSSNIANNQLLPYIIWGGTHAN